MSTINIPETDSNSYREFIEGNSVSVRTVSLGNEADYEKGKNVVVTHLTIEAIGKIVSEPVVIDRGGGKKVLSVVIEKSTV